MELEERARPAVEADGAIEAPPEEAKRARVLLDPGTPTTQQVDEHDLTHPPFSHGAQTLSRSKPKRVTHRRQDRPAGSVDPYDLV